LKDICGKQPEKDEQQSDVNDMHGCKITIFSDDFMHLPMSNLMLDTPTHYEVIPGLLFAGSCPWDMVSGRDLVSELNVLGVQEFITLRDDLNLMDISSRFVSVYPDMSIVQFPIKDFSVPDSQMMRQILDVMKAHVLSNRKVYVSCAKGLGRTGIVIGCFLSEYLDLSGEEALQQMNLKRAQCDFEKDCHSPETPEQIEFVLQWNSSSSIER